MFPTRLPQLIRTILRTSLRTYPQIRGPTSWRKRLATLPPSPIPIVLTLTTLNGSSLPCAPPFEGPRPYLRLKITQPTYLASPAHHPPVPTPYRRQIHHPITPSLHRSAFRLTPLVRLSAVRYLTPGPELPKRLRR